MATPTPCDSTAPPISDSTPPPPDSIKPPPDPDFVTVPTHSRWFTWEGIHECESKQVAEFFDSKLPPHSHSKNPNLYKYIRNSIIKKYRSNPSKKLTFTEARRNIVGDVGSIRRVFDFLDTWGLINYSPPSSSSSSSKWPIKWDDRVEGKSSSSASPALPPHSSGNAIVDRNSKWCTACKTVCSIACFVSDKYELVLCARCYVRGNYRVGLSSGEFIRVEISEPSKEWTDKETLQLLEAVMHYGDDWKRVAQLVSGRTEKECVARFIKLPFGEQFVEPGDHCEEEEEEESIDYENKDQTNVESEHEPFTKKRNITPLADASNPIMAQAAFLSALAGVEVSEAAAQAAVATLYNMHHLARKGNVQPQSPTREHGGNILNMWLNYEPLLEAIMCLRLALHLSDPELGFAANGDSSFSAVEKVCAEQESLLKQEEDEFVASISTITEVQMKEIMDKITHFEQMDLQLDKEWHQVHQMKHQHFLDQLTLLFHKATSPKSVENFAKEENVRTSFSSSTG